MTTTADVIVVGGGVIGLTTAVVLAERGARVRVWSRDPAEETTSAVAGALWWPYRIEPADAVAEWALASLRDHEAAAAAPEETGVRRVPGVHAGERLAGLGPWAAQVPGLREAFGDELPGPYERGLRAELPLIDMPVHLAWLRRRIEAAGGVVERRSVRTLDEACGAAPVVVNCSGLGARELVPDAEVFGVRGQLVLVENPGVEEWFTDVDETASGGLTYFFPHGELVALGGTAEEGAEARVPDPETAAGIVARCAAVRPELGRARVVRHLVGVRPGRRSGVRLAAERRGDGGVLVHNYGHGGAGVTVAWGCARAVAGLL